jgi:hypothetical protein
LGPRGSYGRDWRKLYSEQLHYLYSTNVNLIIKSRRIRWVVAQIGGEKIVHRVLVVIPEGEEHLEDLDAAGRVL